MCGRGGGGEGKGTYAAELSPTPAAATESVSPHHTPSSLRPHFLPLSTVRQAYSAEVACWMRTHSSLRPSPSASPPSLLPLLRLVIVLTYSLGVSSSSSSSFTPAFLSSPSSPSSSSSFSTLRRRVRRPSTHMSTPSTAPAPPPPSLTFNPHTLTELVVPSKDFDSVRVYAISDIHVDYRKNLERFQHWCNSSNSGSSIGGTAGDAGFAPTSLHRQKEERVFSILLIPGMLYSSIGEAGNDHMCLSLPIPLLIPPFPSSFTFSHPYQGTSHPAPRTSVLLLLRPAVVSMPRSLLRAIMTCG